MNRQSSKSRNVKKYNKNSNQTIKYMIANIKAFFFKKNVMGQWVGSGYQMCKPKRKP